MGAKSKACPLGQSSKTSIWTSRVVFQSLLCAVHWGVVSSQKLSLPRETFFYSPRKLMNASPTGHQRQAIKGNLLGDRHKNCGTRHVYKLPSRRCCHSGAQQRDSAMIVPAFQGLWRDYSWLLDVCLIRNLPLGLQR